MTPAQSCILYTLRIQIKFLATNYPNTGKFTQIDDVLLTPSPFGLGYLTHWIFEGFIATTVYRYDGIEQLIICLQTLQISAMVIASEFWRTTLVILDWKAVYG